MLNIISTCILLILDLIWLNLYMGKQYDIMIKKIQNSKMKINIIFAILSYFLMVIGLNIFVLPNIKSNKLVYTSLKYGFLFGIILYGVYDFTAGAVLKDFNKKLLIVDILWGGTVYFLSCYLGVIINNYLSNYFS